MKAIKHEIKINAPLETVFEAINTLKGLQAWHTTHIEGSTELGGVLVFKAVDEPIFKWKVIQITPKESVTWECIEGPGNSVGTQAIYTLSKDNQGRTLVEFSHIQWPHDDPHFHKCNTFWGILLNHLKNYVDTNKAEAKF